MSVQLQQTQRQRSNRCRLCYLEFINNRIIVLTILNNRTFVITKTSPLFLYIVVYIVVIIDRFPHASSAPRAR